MGSKGQSSRSHHRGGGIQHSTLPSNATFSSLLSLTVVIIIIGGEKDRLEWLDSLIVMMMMLMRSIVMYVDAETGDVDREYLVG